MKIASLSALVLILVAQVFAQEQTESAKSKIIALEKSWNQAYKYRDKKALTEILDASLILVGDDGILQSRSAFLLGIDAARPTDEQQAEPESMSVNLIGDTAIATGVFRTRGFANGTAYMKRNRFVDTWVRRGGSWMCIAASATPILQTGN